MVEVLWHGRGGQGAFTAARLLGAAATLSGERYALAFPSFGPERRGAPMRAFTKISDAPIGDRTAITSADIVVYLDGTLFASGWDSELKEGGICLVNSAEPIDDERVIALDATGLALEALGRPIPNTVFLGLIAGLDCGISQDEVEEAIRQYMAPKLHDKNIALVEQAVALAQNYQAAASAEPASSVEVSPEVLAATVHEVRPHADELIIPTLRSSVPGPAVYAVDTCFEGGFITQKNAGWRNIRPSVNAEKCTGCLQCYLYCPDGTIFKRETGEVRPKPAIAFDYDFCKGCGVCAQVCKFGAITMVSEVEALSAEALAHESEVSA